MVRGVALDAPHASPIGAPPAFENRSFGGGDKLRKYTEIFN